jgi:xanthine dehydrogenase/oxidase
MQAVGAQLTIVDSSGTTQYSFQDFLQLNMTGKIITSIVVPFDEANEHFSTFKIMPRHVNSHAYVNAGFRLVTTSDNALTVDKVVITYGGIGPYTIEATKTEQYLVGKDLSNQDTLKEALSVLSSELNPDSPPAAASAAYRNSLALSLFYKVIYQSVFHSLIPTTSVVDYQNSKIIRTLI